MRFWFLNLYWRVRSYITGEPRWHFVKIDGPPGSVKKTIETLMKLSRETKR